MKKYGIEYLRGKLSQKKYRVDTRYGFYEMKNKARDFGISTPPNLMGFSSCLGWCAKAVDSIGDRLMFREFRNDNFGMNDIFNMNNPDVLADSAIRSALISSCSFIYISPDDDGQPRLQVIDGANATGIMDPITGLLTEGYAVLEREDGTHAPLLEAYFEPHKTTYIKYGKPVREFNHAVEYPLLVPVVFRPDAKRPFGHSRISRSCMSIMGSALRTIKRSEISAEFYSFPQKWVVGTDPDMEPLNKWSSAMSALIEITKDEEGDKPSFGQFSQQSIAPHIDQLRMFASLFAGETGLTMDDLGFPNDNPSSAESIKASHENLRLTAVKAQNWFGTGLLNAGMLAASLRDNFSYKRKAIYETKAAWEPVFIPDGAALSVYGDGAIKINQAIPGYFDKENLSDLTGIRPASE